MYGNKKKFYIQLHEIDFKKEHHLGQVRTEGLKEIQRIPLGELKRILEPVAPEKVFQKVPHECRSVNHWGQRKLFISELEFLCLHSSPGDLVVYAGAAPGNHTNFLADLFPSLKFLLFDPAPFSATNTDRLEIRQEFFTEEVCEELLLQNIPILFVSDVRTGDPKVLSNEEVEESIKHDMKIQMAWVKLLRPKASMLKFRLPWDPGSTLYLKGKLYLPIWGRETTTECRLITLLQEIDDLVYYDNTKYERQMFYFNRITRVQYYDHSYVHVGMDSCYDCAAELRVIEDFIRKFNNEFEFEKRVLEMVQKITDGVGHRGRDLRTVEKFYQREYWFAPRVYDYTKRETKIVSRKRYSEELKKSIKERNDYQTLKKGSLKQSASRNDGNLPPGLLKICQ